MTHAANAFMVKIVEALEGIGSGPPWANTEERTIVVERDVDQPMDREQYPLICVYGVSGKRTSDYDSHQSGVYHRTRIVDVCVWWQSTQFDVTADQWLHDIEYALGQDMQLGETCRFIKPVADTRELVGTKDDVLCLLVVTFEVTFGTERKDPSRSV